MIIAAVVVTAAAYFGVMQFRDTTPQLEAGLGTLYPVVPAKNITPMVDYTAPFVILCGPEYDRTVMVTIEPPNPAKLPDGYIPLPEECYSWFRIESANYQGGQWKWDRIHFDSEVRFGAPLFVEAGHYRALTIVMTMPEDTEYYGQKMEVRIRVTEQARGFNVLACEAKWYIETLPKAAESV